MRTAGGRTLGVLAISSRAPQRPLGPQELRLVEVFAGLAALALERTELLDREERRGREERELNEAVRAMSASLELDTVYAAIVEQAGQLVGASKVALRRYEPATADLRTVAAIGFTDDSVRTRFGVGEGMIGHVARTGESYVSDPADADRFAAPVRRARGDRLLRPRPDRARSAPVRRAHRQPRGARLLRRRASSRASRRWRRPPPAPSPTRWTSTASAASPPRSRAGSSPAAPNDVPGFELGLVYEPAGHDVGGGDIFGVWTLPSGALAVLVGDVTGKGLEVAALSAMVRFFVEARTWDSERPGEVLAQTDRLLRRTAAELELRRPPSWR